MQAVYLDDVVIKKLLEEHVPPEPVHIVTFPDARLTRVAKKVEVVDDHVQAAALTMLQLHYASESCAALAATQLSFKDPWMITVIDYSSHKNQPLVLINPVLSEHAGEQNEEEGCMSVYPGLVGSKVRRALTIKVDALDFFGNPLQFEAEDFFAKCIQHEVDHLHGKLYLDRLSSLRRSRVVARIKSAKRDKK